MRRDIFVTRASLPDSNVPLADYTVTQLVSYLTIKYPNAPIDVLNSLMYTHSVSSVIGSQAKLILEAKKYDKSKGVL